MKGFSTTYTPEAIVMHKGAIKVLREILDMDIWME